MFKHDTMEKYVADRAPRLGPFGRPASAIERIAWGTADIMQDARLRAVAALTAPVAPVVTLADRRTVVGANPFVAPGIA